MSKLTPRETQVVLLRSEGLTVAEIATRLNRSQATVDRTLKKAMRKAQVRNAVELLRWAVAEGLVVIPVHPRAVPAPHGAPPRLAVPPSDAFASGSAGMNALSL